ncbi:MAG: AAA family ATPase, partial [Methanosarcinales archaeon]|nr:AAA family ATPase [Methanosarcinales archaeon]
HLSGGEKKRVAIAGVLSMEPEVMILDEPTSNLDPASSEEIMEMLDELNFYGKTILVSTHDVELAYRWADEVVLMNGGRILRHGPAEEVFSDKDLLKQSRMKLPVFMELYEELAGRGMLPPGTPPKSILDLIDLLDHNDRPNGRTTNGRPGRIYVWDVEFGAAGIRDILARGEVKYVGAMGTRAKLLAEKEDICLDFSYGVIDKCILKAINGKSSLIITSGGMVDHAVRRIRSYVDEFGAGLDVEILHPPETARPSEIAPGR